MKKVLFLVTLLGSMHFASAMMTDSKICRDNLDQQLLKRIESNASPEEICKLIEKGADVNAQGKYGSTALIAAIVRGLYDMCKLLIENGADVNASGVFGYTALIWAAQFDHYDVCKLLIENDAEVNAQNEFGNTALMFAAEHNCFDVCKL